MKIFKKLINGKNFIPLLIITIFALLAGRFLLLPGYFNMHDDLQIMRQLELEKCFLDLQIPCRWVPDMGYGFGFPLFNFYPPLPYLVGQIIRLFGFTFVNTVKIVFLLSFIVSGITMYFLAKEFFGIWGGIISSIFYIWAPYHSVDVFVRGAMNEAWALCWFPLILFFAYKLITNTKKKSSAKLIISLALSWVALFLSHNLMVLIFIPLFAVWCLLLFWREKSFNKVRDLIISGLLILGLVAFFTLPAFLEQKYVQVNTLVVGYYEYIAHFATLKQLLFSRFWGYGPSVWLEGDGMPFQIGHLHWILSLVIAVLLVRKLKSNKKLKKDYKQILLITALFILVGWFSLFMSHLRSSFLWKSFPPLKFVQFPWRFLTLATFSFSFVSGVLAKLFSEKTFKILASFLVVILLLLNWNYFVPEKGKMGPLTDEEKLIGVAWEMQQTAGIFDYLPKDAYTAPKEPQKNLAEIMEGEGEISKEEQGTNWAKFSINVTKDSTVRIGIFKFPNWKVFVDGVEVETYVDEKEQWGRMYIHILEGEHDVYLRLFDTPIRTISNYISLITWLGLFYFVFKKRK